MMRGSPSIGVYKQGSAQQQLEAWRDRNRDFVRQSIKLPSGATFTVCKPSNAFATDLVDIEDLD